MSIKNEIDNGDTAHINLSGTDDQFNFMTNSDSRHDTMKMSERYISTELLSFESNDNIILSPIVDSPEPTNKFARAFTESSENLSIKDSFLENDKFDEQLNSIIDNSNMKSATDSHRKAEDEDNSEDDENEEDEEDKNSSRKRHNIREHSKAQREKRKAAIDEMETESKRLTVEHNNISKVMAASFTQYAQRRKYCHAAVTSFLTLWIGGDTTDETENWDALIHPSISFHLPVACTRYVPSSTNTKRRVLIGYKAIRDDTVSFYALRTSISKLGRTPICNFLMGVILPYESFTMENDYCVAQFSIVSKNAFLCGGKHDIDIPGTNIY
jgi:hypothetical protein